MDKKNYLFFHVGTSYEKDYILMDLKKLGYKIIILDDLGINPEFKNIDYHCIAGMDITKIKITILDLIADKNQNIENCFFFTLSDESATLLNSLAHIFNKSPILDSQQDPRDKFWVRKALETSKTEKLALVKMIKNCSELPTFTKEEFPLIVKPISSVQSRNVRIVFNQNELKEACFNIFNNNKTKLICNKTQKEVIVEDIYHQKPIALVESKISGEKLSAELIVYNGEIAFFTITTRFDYENDFFFERAIISGNNIFNNDKKKDIEKYLKNIIKSLSIISSLLHVEIFYHQETNSFTLIEVNFRLGGGKIYELIYSSYGINMVETYLCLLSGDQSDPTINQASEINPIKNWINFGFITKSHGRLVIKKDNVYGYPIEWHFKNGEEISKLATLNFYLIGNVVFPCENYELEKTLLNLAMNANEYFLLTPTSTSLNSDSLCNH